MSRLTCFAHACVAAFAQPVLELISQKDRALIRTGRSLRILFSYLIIYPIDLARSILENMRFRGIILVPTDRVVASMTFLEIFDEMETIAFE